MRIPPFVLGITLVLSIGAAAPAAAQTVVVPEFAVATPAFEVDAAGTYGGFYFLYTPTQFTEQLLMQRVHDAIFDAPSVVNTEGYVTDPAVAPVAGGGFAAVWMQAFEGVGRLLDPLGRPAEFPFQFTDSDLFMATGGLRVAGLTAGTALVWSEESEAFSLEVLKARIAGRNVELAVTTLQWQLASTPEGGCVAAWHAVGGGEDVIRAQVFDADGFATTPALTLPMEPFTLSGVAMSPLDGSMAVVGTRRPFTEYFEVSVLRFDTNGTALGPELVVGEADTDVGVRSIAPSAEYDLAGNLYVTWSRQKTSAKGIYGRALDASGVPFGPAVRVSLLPSAVSVRAKRLPDGRFLTAWITGDTLMANVVSLCAAGSAVCGDGVLSRACERCDDGPGNDDATAGACRTNCLPAHCGDGMVDPGETCDDGNFVSCDGCSPGCTVEVGYTCGDGIRMPSCGEQCDDGNATLLDGCTPACRLERVPGGSGNHDDCFAEWSIANPTNPVPYDKRGGVTARQRCIDNDPRCDFDGGTPGSCTFHVRACVNNTDVPGCTPATRLATWTVVKPSETQAAKSPALAVVRATLLANVPAGILGIIERDACTDVVPVVVPLRTTSGGFKPTTVKLQTRATSYDGAVDKDTLALRCEPAS
jgi:cysteine-rich repeat protein